MDPFERLLARASSEVTGHDANRALWDARAELETRYSNVVCYEMVAAEKDTWSDFLARTIPRLTEHLSAKGLPMLGGPNAILSVWRGDKLFIFDSASFFGAVREIQGLDESGFWKQIAQWRSAIGLSIPREAAGPRALLDIRNSDDSSEFRTDDDLAR
jgi:hypothetical protein